MPLPTPSDVRRLSLRREFDDLDDAVISPVIVEASSHVNEGIVGGRYSQLVALLTAHLLVDRLGGAKGAVRPEIVSERLGPMQRNYQQGSLTLTLTHWLRLAGTTYGRSFASLMELVPTGPVTLYSAEDC